MLGISEWVTFVGFVGQNDLPSYYNLCEWWLYHQLV